LESQNKGKSKTKGPSAIAGGLFHVRARRRFVAGSVCSRTVLGNYDESESRKGTALGLRRAQSLKLSREGKTADP